MRSGAGAGERGQAGPEDRRADQDVPRAHLVPGERRQVQSDRRVIRTGLRRRRRRLPDQGMPRRGLGPSVSRVPTDRPAELDRRVGLIATRTLHLNVPH
jgi:hypothetical protein